MVRTTKQREDTQIEVSVDHHSDQYSVMVTSGGASLASRLESVIAVPGSRSKEALLAEAAGNNKHFWSLSPNSMAAQRQRRADTVRYKSPIKEHRNSALIRRHDGVAGRRRDRESSCPAPSLRTRPPPESTTTTAHTRNSSYTPPTMDERMMRRREASCPPDFTTRSDARPDEILVASSHRRRRGDDSSSAVGGTAVRGGVNESGSMMIFQIKNKNATASRKPNLVTAVASNKAIFLSRVVKKKRVVPAAEK
jgi:hypothetical protein